MMKITEKCRKKRRAALLAGTVLLLAALAGCVDQSQGKTAENTKDIQTVSGQSKSAETLLEISDPQEKAAVEAAKQKVSAMKTEPRIIATSPAVAEVCSRLGLDLVGICETSVTTLPEEYQDLPSVGTAMSPDMEVVSSLSPDWVLSPASLQSDLQPKYEAVGTDWAFLNLRSVPGLYRSMQELGEIFGKEEEAQKQTKEFTDFYEKYQKEHEDKDKPKVLILMGLPGSYIIATENSYVGSLVELAGGENVYAGTEQEFLNVNTEDMKTKEPDLILRTSHALPDQVKEMFQKDFETNDIWKHFQAVEEGRVYDLTYGLFGMSATFDYPQALEELQTLLYPDENGENGQTDTEKTAEETSEKEK